MAAALAVPAYAQEAQMDEIVVTARRVDERLQDVPISITVYNQQQLADRNVTSGVDLASYTPSLSANARYGNENASFAIRGFSQEARTTASVGVYFADVVAPRGGGNSVAVGDGAGPGAFFDLQNVQVLKGPQGTLFGRNTTGGAILLVPQKPTREFEGYVEGSVGNYDLRRLQGVINVPINDAVRLRLGGDWQERDGYLKNISGIGPSRFGDIDYYALRGSLVVDITPDIENYTIASFSRSSTNGQLPKVTLCNPAVATFGALTCDQIGRQEGRSFYTVENSVPEPRTFQRLWQVINTTTWQASDALTVKNIASYSELKNVSTTDYFGVAWLLPETITGAGGAVFPTGALQGTRLQYNNITPAPGGTSANQRNWTNELQLQGRAYDGRLLWQTGAYIERSDPIDDNTVYSATTLTCANRFDLQCTDPIGIITGRPSGGLTIQQFRASYHNYGLYGQATYALNDQFKLTAGYRYTWDKSRSVASNASYTFFPTLSGRCANPTVPGAGIPFVSPAQCLEDVTQESNAPTWVLGLDYTPRTDVLLYAKYARGYRQGSTNPLGAGGFTTFGPESVDAYEAGAKTSWSGQAPGFLNLAVFYNDLQNQQLQQGFLSSSNTAPPNAGIVNVGTSRIWGVELEAGVNLFERLRLNGSYAYLNSKLKEVEDPVFPPGSPYDGFIPLVPGQKLPFTPKNKLSVTATYTLPVPEEVGDVSVGATYTFVGEQIVTASQYAKLPSYQLLNLNMNWREVAGRPVDLSVFATNVLGEKYTVTVNDMFNSRGFVSRLLGEPRMYGMRLRYRFGG